MSAIINEVFQKGISVVNQIQRTQTQNIIDAANLIADAHIHGSKFFVTGSGHSHTVSEELYGRAGVIAFTVPIITAELTLLEHPYKSSMIERLPGYAKILSELYNIKEDDVVLIASNSGRNAYPIEMAIECKKLGAYVIAITNVKHSLSTSSRQPSGHRLMDLADIVIDNCGEVGDSCLHIEGLNETIFPTSTIANSFIVQSINAEVCQYLTKVGLEAPVFTSANIDGGDNKNTEYFQRYTRLY